MSKNKRYKSNQVDLSAPKLHQAIMRQDLHEVKTLIEAGANMKECMKGSGESPLALAAEIGNLEIVATLIETGVDPDFSQSDTPLNHAIWHKHTEVAKALVSAGANIDSDDFGSTPLIEAGIKGDLELVKFLLEVGANINELDQHGCSAILKMAESGQKEVFQYLIQLIPEDEKERARILFFLDSIRHGEMSAINDFLAKGMSLDIVDEDGISALLSAVQGEQIELVRYLIKRGINVSSLPSINSLICAAEKYNIEIVEILLNSGININSIDKNGRTPLLCVVFSGEAIIKTKLRQKAMIRFLLERGADSNIEDNFNNKVLSVAQMSNCDAEIIELLKLSGALE